MDDIDEALLARAEAWVAGDGRGVAAWKMIQDLVAALRLERQRAANVEEHSRNLALDVAAREDELDLERDRACGALAHLRTVLAWGWPEGTTGPACVREARAYLAGEAPSTSTCSFCNGALDDQSFQGLADRVDEVQRLRKDLEAERAAHQTTRNKLTVSRALVDRLAGLRDSLLKDIKRACAARDDLRAELATEQEQHGHTRAALAEARQRLWTLEAGIAALAATMKAGRA